MGKVAKEAAMKTKSRFGLVGVYLTALRLDNRNICPGDLNPPGTRKFGGNSPSIPVLVRSGQGGSWLSMADALMDRKFDFKTSRKIRRSDAPSENSFHMSLR